MVALSLTGVLCLSVVGGMVFTMQMRWLWTAIDASPSSVGRAAAFHVGLGVVTLVATLFKRADYGKFAPTGGGPLAVFALPARLGWFVQECPTLIAVALEVARVLDANDGSWSDLALSPAVIPLALFAVHYAHRTLIFPFRLVKPAPLPAHIVGLAAAYCCFNGRLQVAAAALARGSIAISRTSPAWTAPLATVAVVGVAVFAMGMYINVRSDGELFALRRRREERAPGGAGGAPESRYCIPRGFWPYNFVSCPNFFGELVEWCGYALAATAAAAAATATPLSPTSIVLAPAAGLAHALGFVDVHIGFVPDDVGAASLAAWSFAFYTFANTGPRAIATHAWYLETFGDSYRQLNRKALIPLFL